MRGLQVAGGGAPKLSMKALGVFKLKMLEAINSKLWKNMREGTHAGLQRKKLVMTLFVCVQKYFSILKAEFPEVFSKSFIVETKALVRARCQGIYEKWNVFFINSYIFEFSYSLIIWKPI